MTKHISFAKEILRKKEENVTFQIYILDYLDDVSYIEPNKYLHFQSYQSIHVKIKQWVLTKL